MSRVGKCCPIGLAKNNVVHLWYMKMISKIINNEKVQIWAALLGFLVLNVVFGAVGGA